MVDVAGGSGAEEEDGEGEDESCPLMVGESGGSGCVGGSASVTRSSTRGSQWSPSASGMLGGRTLGGMGSVETVREWRLD